MSASSRLHKDNPTRSLDGSSSKTVVILLDTRNIDEALEFARAIPGFTPDPTKVGPYDGEPGLAVTGEATLPIAEEGVVVCIYNFGGVVDCCERHKVKH